MHIYRSHEAALLAQRQFTFSGIVTGAGLRKLRMDRSCTKHSLFDPFNLYHICPKAAHILTHWCNFFGTPCSTGDQFCLMPKVLANLPGPKAFLHQSCASSSRTPASSLPGQMLLDVFFCYFLLLTFLFLTEVHSEG